MKVAVKCDAHLADDRTRFGPGGEILGNDSGTTLMRRILGLFEQPILLSETGGGVRTAPWGEIRPLAKIDPNETVVVNFDVMEAFGLYTALKRTPRFHHPKIMNFAWWNVPEFKDPNLVAGFAASCATFPLFGNSPKIIREIRAVIRDQVGTRMLPRMRTAHRMLGIDTLKVPVDRNVTEPVVQYPAVFANGRKNPEEFIRICEAAHARTPFKVRMRLLRSQLDAGVLSEFRKHDWVEVSLIPGTKEEYHDRLREETVFLATSRDESYGIGYMEGLYAGLVGILPDREWVHQIVPEGYPFVYRSQPEAEAMLHLAVTNPLTARAMIDEAAGGSIRAWIQQHHDARAFDAAFVNAVGEFFPARSA